MLANVDNIAHQYLIGTKCSVPKVTLTNHVYVHWIIFCGELYLGVGCENVNKLAVTVKIKEQEINLLFDQKLKVKYNINNIYGLVWAYCTDAIHSAIKG